MAVFDTIALSEGFFRANTVNCAVPFNFNNGRRILYGTDDGVYISDLEEVEKEPTKVLPLVNVSQVDVIEDYKLLIVLSERQVLTFSLETLDPMDPAANLKGATQISTEISFFKVGRCLGRMLVSTAKSSKSSTVIQVLEPIEQRSRSGRGVQPTFKKLLQGGIGPLKPFREFYMPVESMSLHYLKTRLCVGCPRGFEIVDLESLETQGLLDTGDKSLGFLKQRSLLPFFTAPRVVSSPMAIYRVNTDFLLCYDKFAFYVDKSGRGSRSEFMVSWEGTPTGFALHWPYVLAFSASFVEIWHVETGAIAQKIPGSNIRLLFADTPPSEDVGRGQSGVGPDEILMVSEDRILAVRLVAANLQG